MKVVRTENQLKMVGKVWEIRAKLRELSTSSLTVSEYLSKFNRQ
ncbi:Z-ring formation inhibitor MciZ [Tepidibacillus marianensis]